jgi:peptidoglycan/xylan/chitin deacetylase (PgdA/CDA1 family)
MNKLLLSFDIEEFDTPIEYGCSIPFELQMEISVNGTKAILNLLRKMNVRATFFCTANFALHATELIRQISEQGHEIASHGFYHSSFDVADLKKSKDTLEQLTGTSITGFRMARMMPVEETEIGSAGYLYNSSLHPTFIPRRYNNFNKPRTYFYKDGFLQIPASVSPFVRLPLFWLSFHHFPFPVYKWLLHQTLRKDKYAVIYFHPWEFVNLNAITDLHLPYLITHGTGEIMLSKLERILKLMHTKSIPCETMEHFALSISKQSVSITQHAESARE